MRTRLVLAWFASLSLLVACSDDATTATPDTGKSDAGADSSSTGGDSSAPDASDASPADSSTSDADLGDAGPGDAGCAGSLANTASVVTITASNATPPTPQ